MTDWLLPPLQVISVLEALEMPYVIGGSVATLVHGVPRLTNDADIVVDFKLDKLDSFVTALEQDFYVEPETIRQAVKRRGSFNLLHYKTMFKVDMFLPKDRSFDRAQLSRRILRVLSSEPPRKVYVLTAEDNIVAKLEWFRMGGDVSQQQWRDVLGILKTKFDELDTAYMRNAAESLEVADLLVLAIEAAGKEN
jgi:hypothetical protein